MEAAAGELTQRVCLAGARCKLEMTLGALQSPFYWHTAAKMRQIPLLISAVLVWSAAALNDTNSDGRAEYVGHTEVIVDLSLTHPVSDLLYGVFFEEVGAGQAVTKFR